MTGDRLDELTSPSPPVSASEAARLVATEYGLRGEAIPLPGERDSNFRIEAGGARYVLKVAHAAQSEEAVSLEIEALAHLEAHAPHLPVQRVIPTRDNRPAASFEAAGGERRHARLTTFLEGELLLSLDPGDALAARVGSTSAELGEALRTFGHPAARRELLWDLGAAEQTRALLDELNGLRDRRPLEDCLDRFAEQVSPSLRGLRAQVVHNDVNRNNTVLLRSGAIGVIDFGDVVHTQLVNDLAVTMSDFLEDARDPWEPALGVLRGFNRVRNLEDGELDVLFSLVRTRLAILVIVTEWRMKRFPENRDYIARKTGRSWSLLERLGEMRDSEVTARFHRACGRG